MSLRSRSQDTERLWGETEKTLRVLLGRGGRFRGRSVSPGRGPRPLMDDFPPHAAAAELLPSPARTARHERALRALAKEMKRLITEDKRRGLDI